VKLSRKTLIERQIEREKTAYGENTFANRIANLDSLHSRVQLFQSQTDTFLKQILFFVRRVCFRDNFHERDDNRQNERKNRYPKKNIDRRGERAGHRVYNGE